MVGCHRCGSRSREGARFCGSCGAALGSARAGDRKTLTVLFADVRRTAGFDDLELDVRASQEVYALLKQVLQQHGATVERSAGDAVMAVFGIPVAHEDDARRAAAAALELHAAVRLLPGDVHVAVGINTGEVLAGDASSDEELAVGDAVVVAARLQQQAAAGETLLGPSTVALLPGALRTGQPREVQLRGREGRLTVVPLLQLLPTPPPGPRGPFVGREPEAHILRAALERTARTGVVQLVTVLGEAGTGKSRLVEQVLAEAEGVRVVRGTCRGYGERSTWAPLGHILQDLTGQAGAAGILELERAHPSLTGAWHVLSSLLGKGDTPVSAALLADTLAKVLAAVAEQGPLVVVLEDLHAGAPPLLDLVPEVLLRLEQVPVAVVVTARPELLEQRQGWGSALRHAVGLTLRPLGEDEARRLAGALLPEDPEGMATVLGAAGGNPMFLEQLAKARREGADIADRAVVPTVAAVLAARLDRLPLGTRGVLERASLVGPSGTTADLAPLCAEVDLEQELARLADRDLVQLTGEQWVLRSELVREVALSSLARDERAHLHQLRGQALRARGVPGAAGYHLEQAALLLRQVDPERSAVLSEQAASLLSAAGLRALSGDVVEACDLLARAADLLPWGSPRRVILLVELARGLQLTGDLVRAEQVLLETVSRSTELGLSEAAAHARLALVDLLRSTEPERAYAELPGLLAEVLPALEAASDDRGLSLAWQLQASALQYRVRWADVERPVERSLHHAQRAGDRRLLELAQTLQVASLFHGPTPLPQVRHELEQALAQPGTSAGQRATVTSYLGAVLALQGDPEAGRELLTEARGAFHDLGREVAELRVALVSAPVELLAGTPDRAVSELTRAVEGLQAMGDRALASTLAALLAEARWRCDDQAGAAAAADLSRRLAGVGDVISQVRWRGVLAKLEAVHRNNEQAQLLSSKAVQLVVETHEVVTQGDVLVDAAEVQLLLGNRGAAEVLLKDALDRYDRKQTPQAAAVARVRLGL